MAHVRLVDPPLPPLPYWTMGELLERCPEAEEVLRRHGVDPSLRCPKALRDLLSLRKLLGITCPADDVAATLLELEALLAQGERLGEHLGS